MVREPPYGVDLDVPMILFTYIRNQGVSRLATVETHRYLGDCRTVTRSKEWSVPDESPTRITHRIGR